MKAILFLFGILFMVSCGQPKSIEEETKGTEETTSPESDIDEGRIVYSSNCKLCHGEDGTAGVSGASNLQKSTMLETDVETIIAYGKGTGMAPYKGILSDEDIKKVAAFVLTLRK